MRITQDTLIELAHREVEGRSATGDVISGYIIGSVARNLPLLGGTIDIDLVLIHDRQPVQPREIVRLSDQVHLDIYHHSRELYAQPRDLRVHPWLGPSMCEPIFLYDPQHFFERAQAGVRGQFYRPDHIYARACAFLERVQQTCALLSLSDRWLKTYTRAVLETANAVACLAGFPVAGRRMMLDLERVLLDLGHPEVYYGFISLLGVETLDGWNIPELFSTWRRAYDLAGEVATKPELLTCRGVYYLSGYQALAEAGRPEAMFWSLLTTWEHALHTLSAAGRDAPYRPSWEATLERLKLSSTSAAMRADDLNRYRDHAQELIEAWAEQNGA